MDKPVDGNIGNFTHRRLSHIKVTARLVEHELAAAKGSKDISVERELLENLLDTLEMFIEDFEEAHGGRAPLARSNNNETKPAVTRLN